MANYIKREIDNFDYNKRFYVPNEHRWCDLKDDKNFEKYYENKEEYLKFNIQNTQADLELTGQKGPYTGGSSDDSGDSDVEN